jgi:flagellar hook-length control protein FliK
MADITTLLAALPTMPEPVLATLPDSLKQLVDDGTIELASNGIPQKKLPSAAADLAALVTVSGNETSSTAVSVAPSEVDSTLAMLARPSLDMPFKTMVRVASTDVAPQPDDQSVDVGSREIADTTLAGLSQAAQTMTRQSVAEQTAGRINTQIAAPLGGVEWRAELGDRIAWMVGKHAQTAEIMLNPPSLGSIEVRLHMNLSGNEASAQFYSGNAQVRDALESAFPRLRELLAGAGINLGEASVGNQSFSGQQLNFASEQADTSENPSPTSVAAIAEPLQMAASRGRGLVDLYI